MTNKKIQWFAISIVVINLSFLGCAGVREDYWGGTKSHGVGYYKERERNRQQGLREELQRLTSAIQAAPNDVENYSRRGDIYRQQEKHREALSDYEVVVRLGDGESVSNALNMIALLHQKSNQHQSAADTYTSLIQYDVNVSPSTYWDRSEVYITLEEFGKALDDLNVYYERVNPIREIRPSFYLRRAMVYEALGRNADAEAERERAVLKKK
jgi:tetratricopeptide (TPR) repeat protein